MSAPCDCGIETPHHHETFIAPNGDTRPAVIYHSNAHPRAEVRDSETGEVIFPAVKGPLVLIHPQSPSNEER